MVLFQVWRPIMKSIKRFIFLFSILFLYQNAFANEAFLEAPAIAAYASNSKKHKSRSGNYEGVDSWKPYYTLINNVQNDTDRTFATSTVGLGFIYFSHVKGDTSLTPASARSVTGGTNTKKVGGFSYNRTPIYDIFFGYRILDWFKVALALQNQNNISFQSRFAPTLVPAGATRTATTSLPDSQFRANIALNAVYAKFMFELPWIMVMKSWMYALYFNAGVGPCWQSWTDIRQYIQYVTAAGLEATFVNTLHQKYGASALWQLDLGIRAKSASLDAVISFVLGCKFNSWGKIPNIGESTQQGSWGFAFRKPYSARMLYSFAPYMGVQWNF